MARALTDILTELNAVYDPQRTSFNSQISGLDPQMQSEQSGLDFQKKDQFQQITDQANRRGMFYSGLPISEEQRYTGGTFLPAVANLHAKYAQQKFNLQDAIAKITSDQYNQAYGVRQGELDTEEKQREFDRQLAAQTAAAGGGGFIPGKVDNPPPKTNPVVPSQADQLLFNQMFIKPDGGQWSNQDLLNDYGATLKSARYGNARDQQKVLFYHTFRPDLFTGAPPTFGAATTAAKNRQLTPDEIKRALTQPAIQSYVNYNNNK